MRILDRYLIRETLGPFSLALGLFTFLLAVFGFSYASAVFANQPTPWMGATERAAQYATNVWYAVLAVKLMGEGASTRKPRQVPE